MADGDAQWAVKLQAPESRDLSLGGGVCVL